jgi:peroxiredoxin
MSVGFLLSKPLSIQKWLGGNMQTAIRCLCCLLVFSLLPLHGNAKDPNKFRPFKLKTTDGTVKTLRDYANKVTLVSFFFPGCPYCSIEMPEQQKIYDKYKDKGVSMVWINVLPEQEKLIASWQAEHHFTVPVLIGASQESLQSDYRLIATPTMYLLGAKGEVLYYQSGSKPDDEKTLEVKIVEALNAAY